MPEAYIKTLSKENFKDLEITFPVEIANVVFKITLEDLYQNFKERLVKELIEEEQKSKLIARIFEEMIEKASNSKIKLNE